MNSHFIIIDSVFRKNSPKVLGIENTLPFVVSNGGVTCKPLLRQFPSVKGHVNPFDVTEGALVCQCWAIEGIIEEGQ